MANMTIKYVSIIKLMKCKKQVGFTIWRNTDQNLEGHEKSGLFNTNWWL